MCDLGCDQIYDICMQKRPKIITVMAHDCEGGGGQRTGPVQIFEESVLNYANRFNEQETPNTGFRTLSEEDLGTWILSVFILGFFVLVI